MSPSESNGINGAARWDLRQGIQTRTRRDCLDLLIRKNRGGLEPIRVPIAHLLQLEGSDVVPGA